MVRRRTHLAMTPRAALAAVLLSVALGVAAAARADVASDQAAAVLVFPKIVVDTSGVLPVPGGPRIDTLVRVSNTSTRPISMHCFWVNANGHCSNAQDVICDPNAAAASSPCGPTGSCVQGWQETDFAVTITARQPVAWLASRGAVLCDPSDTSGALCLPLGPDHPGPGGQDNSGSRIQGVSEDPFIGELKCVAVDSNGVPVDRNDLKGEAEITRLTGATPDVEGYNAIGIPAVVGANNGDTTLVLGGSTAEYSSCPNILILDHFFDGANDPISGDTVTTDLTLVPCTEDFLTQAPITTPVQFLVFNEFEQRFSTSRRITCFDEIPISNIETRSADRSIFSAAVSGTLTGQTRIRGVDQPNVPGTPAHGNTLLGIAEEFRAGGGSAAVNLHFHGTRPQPDYIYLPPPN